MTQLLILCVIRLVVRIVASQNTKLLLQPILFLFILKGLTPMVAPVARALGA